jgi:hypothetical protein
VVMYVLMSVFHVSPWLTLFSNWRNDVVVEIVDANRLHRECAAKEGTREQRDAEQEIGAIGRKIDAAVTLADNGGDPKELVPKLNALVVQRQELSAIAAWATESKPIAFYPMAADRHRQKVALAQEASRIGDAAGREVTSLVREFVDRTGIAPTLPGEPPNLEFSGNLAAVLGQPSKLRSLVPVVAGGARQRQPRARRQAFPGTECCALQVWPVRAWEVTIV